MVILEEQPLYHATRGSIHSNLAGAFGAKANAPLQFEFENPGTAEALALGCLPGISARAMITC
jgi:hypothetical protein